MNKYNLSRCACLFLEALPGFAISAAVLLKHATPSVPQCPCNSMVDCRNSKVLATIPHVPLLTARHDLHSAV